MHTETDRSELLDLPFLAFAEIESNGEIIFASRNWSIFGFDNFLVGHKTDEEICALWGIFPLQSRDEIYMPLVVSASGRYLDFTIKPHEDHYIVFAHDVTSKALALQELQQVRNELEFLRRDIYRVFPDKSKTYEKEYRRELVQQTKNLIYTSRLAALGEMASGLSHEINNPLMIIQGGIEIVERMLKKNGQFTGKIMEFINRSKEAITRIVYIVDGLKNFARQDQGYPKEIVRLKTVVEETFVFCFEMLKNHKINLMVDEVPHVDISCRPLQISQVLFNLIKNADEALSADEDRSHKWIRIRFKESLSHIFIYVSNGGEHISASDQNKIFQPFFTTKDVGEGAGMGLSISRGIMQEHEGELIYDWHAPDTTFIIKLLKAVEH